MNRSRIDWLRIHRYAVQTLIEDWFRTPVNACSAGLVIGFTGGAAVALLIVEATA